MKLNPILWLFWPCFRNFDNHFFKVKKIRQNHRDWHAYNTVHCRCAVCVSWFELSWASSLVTPGSSNTGAAAAAAAAVFHGASRSWVSSLAELESKRFDTLELLSVGLHHYCRDFNIVTWIDERNLSLELVKVLLMSTFLNDCLIFLWKFYFEKWLSKFMARNNHNLGSIMLQFLHQINAWKLSYWTRKRGFFFDRQLWSRKPETLAY